MENKDYNLPKITSAMFILTHSCNLECRYCFVHQEPCHMDLDTAFDATKFLIRNAEEVGETPQINFFGGEPLLMWDSIIEPLVQWIRGVYRKPFDLSITTNGTLLDEEKIEFLKKYRITLLFSIDGSKKTQDYNRPLHNGKSSFDVLENIIPQVVKNFPNTTFRMTTIPPTCNNTFDNIMFAKYHGFKNFFVIPNIFEEWDESSRSMLKNEMRKYSDYYINSYRSGEFPINFSAYDTSFNDILMINNAIKNNEHRSLSRCHACGKCGLGSNKYASIHPNGNIYGCQEMTSNEGKDSIFYIGNIFTGVKDKRRISLMDLYDSTKFTGANCDTCKLNRVCNGGCVANNYLITGSMSHVPEMFCWWQQLILDEAIYVMQTLGNEQNELFKKKWSRMI